MGSQTLPKLPVVNLSKENLKPGTSTWFSTRNDVKRALEEYGCFIAVCSEVSSELHNAIFHSTEELLDLPTETKTQNTNDKPSHGYVGNVSILPLLESLGIDNATTLEAIQSFTNLMWPAGNDRFCETVHSYTKIVSELEQMVKRMIFESYGAEKYYDSHIGSTTYLLRLMKYRKRLMNEVNIGVNAHTDKSFITILHQNQVNGLEIETKDGEWIGFETLPSSFVVMAGDALLAWSNGRIHSANHRVTIRVNEARYTLGLFSLYNGIIQIPEEVADDEHPLQFKSFDHFGLLHFYYTEEGQKAKCLVKAYCGV